ncbi:MAG: exosortase-associated EpsI family protein [Phycisphaerales bacterium]|nr:MAG: exosortase-associated EpsI family protein [Phycisphaerales bacterium]
MTKRREGFYSIHTAAGQIPVWFAWILALLLLVSGGVTYRILASRLKLVVGTPIKLPVPLEAFPRQVGQWVGQDVPIPANIQRVAGNDASLNRLYRNETSNQWANVYIAYTAHPRTMLGHRPQICYVAGGWVHDGTQPATVTSGAGREIPCLVHRFHRPSPETEETVVFNFYIVNGQLTSDESVFSGVGWRTPNIGGDPARYVTQVQIGSILENSIRAAAKDITELILDFFPDEQGRVRAIEHDEGPKAIGK